MTTRLHRRTLLSKLVVGVTTLGAGCSTATSPGATPESSPTTAPPPTTTTGKRRTTKRTTTTTQTLSMGETATSAAGVSVTVSEPRVRKILFTPDAGSYGHSYPAGDRDSQFLVVSVSAPGTDVASLELAPVLDGTARMGQPYRHSVSPGESGRLGFRVPVVEAEHVAVEWRPNDTERYRWTLPESVLADLGDSPRFEVKQFAVPETIPRGDDFTATLEVANAGDRDGRFLGVVLDQGPSSLPLVGEFTLSVPTGETVTRDLSGRAVETDRPSATAVLDWGIGQREANFSIGE